MFVGLFGLGLLNTAVGIVTIGLGIPIRALNLGNTLILSGTVAVVGGIYFDWFGRPDPSIEIVWPK